MKHKGCVCSLWFLYFQTETLLGTPSDSEVSPSVERTPSSGQNGNENPTLGSKVGLLCIFRLSHP